MSKILSQEEVDALLNTIENTDRNSDNEGSNNNLSYRIYDFKKKKSSSVFDISIFEFVAERFINYLKPVISSLLLKNIKIQTKSVKTVTMREFKESLTFPSGIYYVKMKPLEGKSIIVFDDMTAFGFVELFFGGNNITERKFEERPFTLVEQKILKKIVSETIEPLKKAFLPIYNFEPELMNLEMRPKFINICIDREKVAVFDISIFIEDFEGKMYYLIPYSTLEPIDIKLNEEDEKEINEEVIKEEMVNALKEVPLNITVEISQINMTLDEIRNLKKDDILTLGKSSTDELNVYVENELKFKGVHGVYKGNHAVKITKVL